MGAGVQGDTIWQEEIYRILKSGNVRQVAYVPDAGHSHVIHRVNNDDLIHAIPVTTEEEGVASVCGGWLGGQRGALLMQSSGVGNCVNMFSLVGNCRFPFLSLVTMRGEWVEFNPWQNPMGHATAQAFEMMGISVLTVDRPEQVPDVVQAAFDSVFKAGEAVAVLLSQRLMAPKEWGVSR